MFSKAQLFVIVGFLLIFGCKNTGIDHSVLDDGLDSPSSPWAMVDLYLLESDDAEDEGEVMLVLSEHLTQDTDVSGVNLTFAANGTLDFTAPDASNVATLADDGVLIRSAEINFVNSIDVPVCPDNPIVAKALIRDGEDGVMFKATDLACAGNKMVEMNAIALSIQELAGVSSHAWLEDHKEVLKTADAFYEKEKKSALRETEDKGINDAIDNFLIRRKMLKGYDAMHTELEKQRNLAEMKTQVKNAGQYKDSDKHIVIPATLNAFLDIRVNNRVIPDDSTGTGRDTDLMLLKEAMGNAAAKLLQYDYLFRSDTDFASAETMSKYANIKGQLPSEVSSHVEEIEKRFDQLKLNDDNVYTAASGVFNPLSERLACMNRFLNEQKAAGEVCESILGEFYNGLSSPLGPAFSPEINDPEKKPAYHCEQEDGDVFILLTTRKIMLATNIHDLCKDYTIKMDKFNKDGTSLIREGVTDIKNASIKSMEDMVKNYGKNDFRAKLLQNNFYAAVPVVTKHPEKAAELARAVSVAHDDIYKKRQKDSNWQRWLGWIYTGAAILGLVSVVLWLIPPAGAFVTGATSLLAAIAVGAGGFLAAGYAKDWFNEKNDYGRLEKAIYSGGQGDVAGLADTMQEWKESKRMAIWEGIFTTVGVGGARRIITDPRALRTAYTRANIGQKLKSWHETRKAGKGARQAAKAAANTDEAIAAQQRLKDRLASLRASSKTNKKNLKEAKKALKANPHSTDLKREVETLETLRTQFSKNRSKMLTELRATQGLRGKVIQGIKNAGRGLAAGIPRPFKQGKIVGTAEEAKGFFTRAREEISSWPKRLLESRKKIHALNRSAWSLRNNTKEINKLAKEVRNAGGKFNWRLNKDGTAVFKADVAAHTYLLANPGKLPEGAMLVKDFKLGADGLWIAVWGADKVDKLFGGNKGKRAIEGRIPGFVKDRL